MYLSELRLWNFRKYGVDTDDFDDTEPGIKVKLNPGINVMIGENDSGKTTIVDAIRHLLGTQSRDWYRLESSDFYGTGDKRTKKLKIEAIFRGFTIQEAAPFLEWMGFEENEDKQEYVLTVRLLAERKINRIIMDYRAGPDHLGAQIDGEARDLLRVTYLKPLRDADGELTPGRRSRLAQILSAHQLFQNISSGNMDQKHKLEEIVGDANTAIKQYFCPTDGDAPGGEVMQKINAFLTEFFPDGDVPEAEINISGGDLDEILRRLALILEENPAGLGSLNLLYIAAELLLLQSSDFQGLRLGIVEELEAHLHPQAQLRLIAFLDKHANDETKGQFILTTHSTTIGASVDLKNLLICNGKKVFPMAIEDTKLERKNYDFLRRFLDATKTNLFFARGVILVEGDAENLLLPTIAEIIDRPLHRYGVSIVNVGSTAFLHYAKIFTRNDGQTMEIPVAVVTDMDVKPSLCKDKDIDTRSEPDIEEAKTKQRKKVNKEYDHDKVKSFISTNWTLEYEISLDPVFTKLFYTSVLWAEKLSNASMGEPQKNKWSEVEDKVEQDFARWNNDWNDDQGKSEKIAFEIYNNTMLDKNISKAIVAQVFAESLSKNNPDKKKLRDDILRSEHLKYLVDAIYHVTKPREPVGNDNAN